MTRWLITYCPVQDSEAVQRAEQLGEPNLMPPTEWARVVVDLEDVAAFRENHIDEEPATSLVLRSGAPLIVRMSFDRFFDEHKAWRDREAREARARGGKSSEGD